MPNARARAAFDPVGAMLAAFDTNQQMYELLLESIAPGVWRLEPQPPGQRKSKDAR